VATGIVSRDPNKNVEQLFAMLKSVSEFDKIEFADCQHDHFTDGA